MHFRQAILKVDNKTYHLAPERSNSFDEIFADFQRIAEHAGERWSVFLHPKQDVSIQRLEIQFNVQLSGDAHFFANGFQSQSESRLLPVTGSIPRLRTFARKRLGFYGDEHIPGIARGRGYLHAWTYTYIIPDAASSPQQCLFIGSLKESTGFTLLLYDGPNGILTVRKDLEGLRLSHSFPALDFWVGEGREQELFDRYFQALQLPPPGTPPALGWTSRQGHFRDISEELLLQNLDSFAAFCRSEEEEGSLKNNTYNIDSQLFESNKNELLPAFFQIDDGWQTAVGDWLSVSASFPRGMGFLSQQIRGRGLWPGLWLAPFVAARHSDLAKMHPGWLLKGKGGKPLKAGWNPAWGGWYFALDFYNNHVRNYLGGVLHTVLDRWGYELLKLDFLFAACLAPPPGKTRGQVMHEAMEFLRKLAGPKKILACSVPLGAAFGWADYCQVGGGMPAAWERRLPAFLHFREQAGALAALRSALGRRQLNGRVFHSDPGVFTLRPGGQSLSAAQQYTILIINILVGNIVFTSDNFGQYSPEQRGELEAALELRGSRVTSVVELENNVYRIDFEQPGSRYAAFCNLTPRAHRVSPGVAGAADIELRAFESIVLKISSS